MSKWLKADGTSADAYLTKDLSALDEVYVSYSVYLSDAFFTAGGAGLHLLAQDVLHGKYEGLDAYPSEIDEWLNGEVIAIAAGLHTIAIHAKISTDTLVITVDGTAVDLSGEGLFAGSSVAEFDEFDLGALFSAFDVPPTGSIPYFSDVKVGTTGAGSSDVLEDDFSGGDFSLWDSTSGTVTIVDSLPEVIQRGVCIAFSDDTLEPTPTWTSLSETYGSDGLRVQKVVIDRGRQDELNTMNKGVMTVTVLDFAGILDITNPSSPLLNVPNALPQIAHFVTDPHSNTEQCRFRGFISQIQTVYDISQKYMTHTISCVDILDILDAAEVQPDATGNTTYSEGPVNDRILAALSDAGITDSFWIGRINSGNVDVQETTYAPRTPILEVIQEAADAEFPGVANLYATKDGPPAFNGRYARFNPDDAQYDISQWKAGDGPACVADSNRAPVTDITFTQLDITYVLNAVLAYPAGIADADMVGQLSTATTSIDQIGVRGTAFENLRTYQGHEVSALDANNETREMAEYYTNNYPSPLVRIPELHFTNRSAGSPNPGKWWALVTGVDLNDIVNYGSTHIGGGGFGDLDYYVEQIHEEWDPPYADGDPVLDMTLNLSPRAYFSNTYPDGPT